jgi:uncharacterized membrane protein
MIFVKKVLRAFHSSESFKKHGFKQISTWAGVLIFICVFDNDLLVLVHNVLTDANLAEKLGTGLAGLALVWFNKLEKK